MTTNELIKVLQSEVAEHPEAGNADLLIWRDNGKRIRRQHKVTGWGWELSGPATGRIRFQIDFVGAPY